MAASCRLSTFPGNADPSGTTRTGSSRRQTLTNAEAHASRRLREAFSPGMWITKDRKRTDPEMCDKYVEEATTGGNLFEPPVRARLLPDHSAEDLSPPQRRQDHDGGYEGS